MKNLTIILLALILLGCNKKQYNKEADIYKVLEAINNEFITSRVKANVFQPSPPTYKNQNISWDSINKLIELDKLIPKDTIKKMDSLIKKYGRFLVDIDTILRPPNNLDIKEKDIKEYLNLGFNQIYLSFKKIKDSISIDISKIPNNKYSYILPYHRGFYKLYPRKPYSSLFVIFFTNIVFNQEKNKAIIVMKVRKSRKSGFSTMYFLEKRKGKWFIKHIKELSIS